MKVHWICCSVLAGTALFAADSGAEGRPPSEAPQLIGFTSESSPAQIDWEKKLREAIVPANIRENMRRLSARPHHVGSPYDKDNAEWILARFKEAGFDARIETFDVLFPTPKVRRIEMLEPTRYTAGMQEPALPSDPTSNQRAEQLPTYNAYSADGDVTAPLVYVNYGNREDYEQLDRLGISVKGAIVIARYGHGWRGIKPKVAGEHGAIGCIIYSDPSGDGYFQGDDYPAGGWRPRLGVQRGSVMDTDYPGDPLTPGVGATADAKRLALKDAKTITRVPVLPISYGDALPLLSALKGPVAPEEWRGVLPITYHVGPGPARVHLEVASNWDVKPVYDVIGVIHGADDEQWVLRGNHHDAWVNGAEDPVSGQAVLLEEARVLGDLHRQGWVPKRTIVYCAWDGEEPGLLGSVEWVETHLAELQKKAVAYINSDGNERGFLFPGGTHDPADLRERRGPRRPGPGDAHVGSSALAPGEHREGEGCRRAERPPQAQGSAGRRPGRWIGLHRLSGFRRDLDPQPRVRRTRTTGPSTTPSTTTSTGTPTSATPTSRTGAPWRRRSAPRRCAWRTRT